MAFLWPEGQNVVFFCLTVKKWKYIPQSVYSQLSKNAAFDFTLAYFFFFFFFTQFPLKGCRQTGPFIPATNLQFNYSLRILSGYG